MSKSTGEQVRFIKNYELIELSIVDSPANQLCNVLSISKSNGQFVFKGMAAEVVTENIFYCEDSDSIFISTEKTYESPVTGKDATLIGWVESSDVNKAKEIDKILASFRKSRLPLPETTIAKQANVEGGNEMEKLNVNKEAEAKEASIAEAPVETALPESVVAEAVEAAADSVIAEAEDIVSEADADIEKSDVVSADAETTPADSVEKAAETTAEVEQPDFAKMLGELKGFFSETLVKATEANALQVSEIKETVESFSKSVNAQITELAEKHTALSAAVTEIKGTIDGVQKRVDAVESDTAIKKSSDLGRSEVVTKSNSKWHGAFLGSVNEIFN